MNSQSSLKSRILLSYTTTDLDTQSEIRKVIVTSQDDAARFLNDTQLQSCTDGDWRDLKIERYDGLSVEALDGIRWLRDLQDLTTQIETRITTGDLTSIQDVVESITTHSIFSGIKILEDFGYCEPDGDFSEK